VNAFEALVRGWLGADLCRVACVFALVSARTLPLAFVAPWLGWTRTAFSARIVVATVIAASLTPLALTITPALPEGGFELVMLGAREVLVGAAFAAATSIPLYALGWAGQLVDRLRTSGSFGAGESSPLGTLHLSAGAVLFVSLGGHRLALAAFAEALSDAPIGASASAHELSAFALGAGRIVTSALELAVAFAAPAAIAFVVLELALGLAERFGTELRAASLAVPMRAALGVAVALIGISALLPRLPSIYARSIEAASALVRQLGP
jgi:type III secretory pathway component EscT